MKRHYLSIALLIIITCLSLLPIREVPGSDVPFADKWAHWLMYGTLTIVILWESRKKNGAYSAWRTIYPVLLSLTWGGLMELAQANLTTTRSGEWLDFAANSFGAICGALLYHAVRRATARRA